MLMPSQDMRILIATKPPAFSIGLEKPGRLRTEGSLNEHAERHINATGPILEAVAANHPQARIDDPLPWNFKPSS